MRVAKLKERFGLDHVVLVGDRGLITQARIAADLAPAGLDWITALRAPAIRGLVDGGALQLSLFDERDNHMGEAPRGFDSSGDRQCQLMRSLPVLLVSGTVLIASNAERRELFWLRL